MHLKSDNIEIMIDNEADEAMKELFDSLKRRYQNDLKSMKGSELLFDYFINITYYFINVINIINIIK